jgi:DNA processing protein
MESNRLQLLALCALRPEGRSLDWSMLARVALAGHLDDLYNGTIPASESHEIRAKSTPLLRQGLANLAEAEERVAAELIAAEQVGAWLIYCLRPELPKKPSGGAGPSAIPVCPWRPGCGG